MSWSLPRHLEKVRLRRMARACASTAGLVVLSWAPAVSAEPSDRAIRERTAVVRVRPCLTRFPSPGVQGGPLDCVPSGTGVVQIRTREDWTLVRTSAGTVGWSLTRFLAEPEAIGDDALSVGRIHGRRCLVRRASPRATGLNLDCLAHGSRLARLREQGPWTLVRSDGGEVGWVASAFLSEAGGRAAAGADTKSGRSAPSAAAASAPAPARFPVTPGREAARRLYPTARIEANPCLRLRVQPAADAGVLDCPAHGERVELIGRLGDWTQVRSPEGVVGWVPSEQLSEGFGSPFLITDADVAHVQEPAGFESEADPDAPGESKPEERGLEVDKWATSDEKAEGLMIVGLLRNMGTRINTAVTLTVKVFDWEERVVLEQPAMVDTTILMPGQGTRFEVTLPGIFAFRAVEFDTSSVDFEVTDSALISTI